MSQGVSCRCPREGVRVVTRRANYSAFNGYHYTPSDYSAVQCLCCGASWRTKAKWVDAAKDLTREDIIGAGRCEHPKKKLHTGFRHS